MFSAQDLQLIAEVDGGGHYLVEEDGQMQGEWQAWFYGSEAGGPQQVMRRAPLGNCLGACAMHANRGTTLPYTSPPGDSTHGGSSGQHADGLVSTLVSE